MYICVFQANGQICSDDKTKSLLAAENAALKEQVATSLVTGRTLKEELAIVLENARTIKEGLEEENLKLSADLRFQKEENQKVQNKWKVKNEALLDCEEKLRSRILEQEHLKNQITETNEKLSAERKEVERMIHRNFAIGVRYIRSFWI